MTKASEKRQLAVLQYIYDCVEERGYPPTVREIGKVVNLSSTSTVHGHLSKLEKKGLIKRDPTKPRAIEVTAQGREKLGVTTTATPDNFIPQIGTVTAGEPILAEQNVDGFFPLPPDIEDNNDLFMLTIKGESMINCGILNGDQVIVRRQSTADNGDIVIAMTDLNEATCKRFFLEDGHIRLQPENDSFEPIILSDVTILGKVIGLYRNMLY
ncbi:transcriptional repressor LexA [Ligilactobacillus saerimneri]|uniref:LexA repressor n=2 Tax=Ligilactobacillus saerimneri TaxID=228229 RepID=M5J5T8_9LACO|nr:transcriptional repressor LexA [Ligilactobacillus saerimneri]EKW98625.1 transcription repressor and protease LexA of the SOS regulon [Ligilactobacillus saerimneri 30a]KRL74990.1 lexa repressor [Ligilactobacillus saerimneri DSM 16049]MDI9205666.1 transcriptional repressor LexA [Ligilactobacillus saerimneri]MDY4003268.1 transcriptional repressor LexA [Ligilactobacillus saerimneri]QLL77858.1 transcriptional repressor LexA [Ligilactobacillus saerimneri]